MTYDYTVFIGRFQPLHAGHYTVIQEALRRSKRLIMVLGSAESPRNSRNPFTVEERIDIIKAALTPDELKRVVFTAVADIYNEMSWAVAVQSAVTNAQMTYWQAGPISTALIGYEKDGTSYYLKMFPMWDSINVKQDIVLSATDLRNDLYANRPLRTNTYVSTAHIDAIWKATSTAEFAQMRREAEFINKTKKIWSVAPYPVTFVTVDAIVTCSAHILLIKRRAEPGKNNWALPGGYLDVNEKIKVSAVRELYEETKIDLPRSLFERMVETAPCKVFDDVHRSERGRIITHAFHFDLGNNYTKLPKIKGADDAEKARWVPLSEFYKMRSVMFEDHFNIIIDFIGLNTNG